MIRAALGLFSLGIGMMEFVVFGIPAIFITIAVCISLFTPIFEFVRQHWIWFAVLPVLFLGVFLVTWCLKWRARRERESKAAERDQNSIRERSEYFRFLSTVENDTADEVAKKYVTRRSKVAARF